MNTHVLLVQGAVDFQEFGDPFVLVSTLLPRPFPYIPKALGLGRLDLAWRGLAWLGLTWLGSVRLDLAWLGLFWRRGSPSPMAPWFYGPMLPCPHGAMVP